MLGSFWVTKWDQRYLGYRLNFSKGMSWGIVMSWVYMAFRPLLRQNIGLGDHAQMVGSISLFYSKMFIAMRRSLPYLSFISQNRIFTTMPRVVLSDSYTSQCGCFHDEEQVLQVYLQGSLCQDKMLLILHFDDSQHFK